MSTFPESLYNQTITYWAPSTPDMYGEPTFDTPVTMEGRWQEINEVFTSPRGDEIVSRAVVYVENDVQLNGYLALGVFNDADPTDINTAYEIKVFQKHPSISANMFLRKAVL